jgi:hypothetical protein
MSPWVQVKYVKYGIKYVKDELDMLNTGVIR